MHCCMHVCLLSSEPVFQPMSRQKYSQCPALSLLTTAVVWITCHSCSPQMAALNHLARSLFLPETKFLTADNTSKSPETGLSVFIANKTTITRSLCL